MIISIAFWIAERIDSISVRLEMMATTIREHASASNGDLEMPYYQEGPEGDE